MCNGGVINPKELEERGGFAADVDVKRTVNSNDAFKRTKISIELFHTLDEQTLQERGNRENNLSSIMENHYLPNAQEAYREYVNLQSIEGLVGKRFIVIATSMSSRFVILLSCDELL